jgi:hypothetical protein
MARPKKKQVDPVLAAKLIEVLTSGATVKDSCAYVGIGVDQFYHDLARFPDFRDAIEKARATAKVSSVAVIRKAATGNWQAAAWFLERSDPANWGRKDVLIQLGIDPALLKELKKQADAKGVDLASVFESMIQEFANVDTAGDSP